MIVVKYKKIWRGLSFFGKWHNKNMDSMNYFIYRIQDEFCDTYYVLTDKECRSLKRIQDVVDEIGYNGCTNDCICECLTDAIDAYADEMQTVLAEFETTYKEEE